ncbi:CNNM domain-containing protein [Orrella daihaiensis]|uniref:HlyC/CorC family transporter n=1 Tax=Orrella daihaiensis TaxID=2782176 RepID=A0ABY4AK93_9BURK|nr:hemolysin family protein [Orrella daihaiensis]UOD49492.1 HlyC/CorC family transporter [Orrella daihaiensis]
MGSDDAGAISDLAHHATVLVADINSVAMSTDVGLLIAYVLLALLFSFLCSVAEASLLSITPAYVAGLREKNPKRAELLRQLKGEKIDQSLAAILTVNTIAHTVGAIGAGSKATVVFGDVWFGVFSAVMTLLILFLSEIVPKTLGAVYWREVSGLTAIYVNFLIKSMYPLIIVSELITKWISGGKKTGDFDREEFVAMAGLGHEMGHLNERESAIIGNLFGFKSLKTSAIMTPRVVVAAVKADMTVDEALEKTSSVPFSRLPIYPETIDEVTGFVLREDLLLAQSREQGAELVDKYRRDLVAVLDTLPVSKVLETLLQERQHIALVVGEYGETEGIVTLEDVVETLLGSEILDEGDRVVDMQRLAQQLRKKRAERMGIKLGEDGVPDIPSKTS